MRRCRSLPALVVAVLAGCGGVTISGDPNNQQSGDDQPQLDAPQGSDGSGSNVEPPDGPAPDLRRKIFLNFEGQALTKGPSDATANQAAWMQGASGTAPKYRAGLGTRDTDIQTIVDGVTTKLAGIAEVVTTRPAQGPYMMIVFGGQAGDVQSFYGSAVDQLDCGDVFPNDVAWISDDGEGVQAVNNVMGAIGFGLGLTSTTDTSDCMCAWANECQPSGAACVLHDDIARDTTVFNGPDGKPQSCPAAGAKQDERQSFVDAFK